MKGIYYIKCTINKKVYIGSSINIEQRIKRHLWMLKNNKHSNSYFQNIYNKYKLTNLKFGVIELCEEDNLCQREQYYIDNNKKLINIAKIDVIRISLDETTRNKISKTLTKKFKNGKINRINSGSFNKGHFPWNKGEKYINTKHLKVPKTNTLKRQKSRLKIKENHRDKMPKVLVYKDDTFICKYRCGKDLEEDSLTNNFKLKKYMKLRNPKGRNGLSAYFLQTVNINKCAKINKQYKGLTFKICHPNK